MQSILFSHYVWKHFERQFKCIDTGAKQGVVLVEDSNHLKIKTVFIVGGAGFIGSHFVDALLSDSDTTKVSVFDNFSSGKHWHLENWVSDKRLTIIEADVRNFQLLKDSMIGHEVVIHLASNPDIAAAATTPAIDFDQGTLLTHYVAEAARMSGVHTVLYASGSGVYGDIGEIEAAEDYGPLTPVSTYAASKLAGEALLSSYAFMFGLRAIAFRFGNVVGPRQTHGVGFDFIRNIRKDPTRISILGDGQQSKSYVFVGDIVRSVLLAHSKVNSPFDVFNVATGDYITVTDIATLACEISGLDPKLVKFEYAGGDRGWKGDVPVVRLSSEKIRLLGWQQSMNCVESMRYSMTAMLTEPRLFN
jgi:UDP-glucose 4-epimerase